MVLGVLDVFSSIALSFSLFIDVKLFGGIFLGTELINYRSPFTGFGLRGFCICCVAEGGGDNGGKENIVVEANNFELRILMIL